MKDLLFQSTPQAHHYTGHELPLVVMTLKIVENEGLAQGTFLIGFFLAAQKSSATRKHTTRHL
jgi:hypothetical protein